MKRLLSAFLVSCWLFLFLSSQSWAAEDAKLRKNAKIKAREGNPDLAYMQYRRILREFPQSAYLPEAIWGEAEYSFYSHDFAAAKKNFELFLSKNPAPDSELFALAYLWTIANAQNDSPQSSEIAQKIIKRQPVSLVFRNTRTIKYTSPLGRRLKLVFQIDKIFFSAQGEQLAEIPF